MKQRHFGIELLRIVSMMMVLGLHANYLALGSPDTETILSAEGLTRTVFQSLCIIAVDVFVMISGWFGIRASVKGFCNFLWQVFFIVGIVYLAKVVVFHEPIGIKDIFRTIGLFGGGGWFVAAYIGLYILSPILNVFIESTPTKKIWTVLAAFFIFEIIWGDTLSTAFIACGYSTFSFIGLYVLTGFLRKLNIEISSAKLIAGIIAITVINSTLYIFFARLNLIAIRDIILNYINPLVIASAAITLILFIRISPPTIKSISHIVTQIFAPSCFAAYLLHTGTTYALSKYCKGVSIIYNEYSGCTTIAMIILYIIMVFIMAIIIDQPRKLLWKHLLLPLFNNKNG